MNFSMCYYEMFLRAHYKYISTTIRGLLWVVLGIISCKSAKTPLVS